MGDQGLKDRSEELYRQVKARSMKQDTGYTGTVQAGQN